MADDPSVTRRQVVSALATVSAVAPLAGSAQGLPKGQLQDAAAAASRPLPGKGNRTIEERLGDRISVLDFDVDPTGRNDSSAGFRRAIEQVGAAQIFVPRGAYLVQDLPLLGGAGVQVVGDSRWRTVLRSERGAGALFRNQVADSGTSAFHLLSDFTIDLNGNDRVAIDLASINASTIQRVHFIGGSAGRRSGVGVRFAAPLEKGAYDNALYDCTFEYLDRGVVFDSAANANSAYNCRILNCRIGYDAAPAREVDTPRIFGGRVEGCDIGLREGASFGAYFAVRFEDSGIADVEFTPRSANAAFWGGYTATTALAVKGLNQATSPSIEAADFGNVQVDESTDRARISTGRHVLAKPGKPPAPFAGQDYAAYFHDPVIFRNNVAVEFAAPDGAGRIIGLHADHHGGLTLSGFDRTAGGHVTITLGGGAAVQPIRHATTDLGTASLAYRTLHVSNGLTVGGKKMLSQRQPAIADDRTRAVNSATLNEILGALRRLGLIES